MGYFRRDHSAYVNLQNEGKNPSEAHIIKTIDGKLIGGLNYELSFFVKQIKPGTGGYIQQYVVEWWDEDQQAVKGTGFKQFSSKIGEWDEIVVPNLDIPENVRSLSHLMLMDLLSIRVRLIYGMTMVVLQESLQ